MIKKILFLLLVVFLLSYIGQTLSRHMYAFEDQSFSDALILIRDNLGFVILSNVLLYIIELIRIFLIGSALKIKFSFRDAFGAVSLNILFGWLSPAAILGAPAMAYYLHKRGCSVAEAITVAFVRSFSIIFVSAITTIVIYGFDLQGLPANVVLQEKIFQILILIAVYISTVVFLSFVPFKFVKKIKVLDKITTQIRFFLTEGKLVIIPVLFLTLVLNFLLVCFVPYVSAHYYPTMGPLISQTLLFLSYMLLMPTPGASGLAEVGAPMFFQSQVPLQEIITNVTAMRVSSITFQVLAGVVFMFFFMKDSLSFADLKKFKESQK